MHPSPHRNLALLPARMVGGRAKKLLLRESLEHLIHHPSQVARDGLGLRMNDPLKRDLSGGLLRSGLLRNDGFTVPFRILYGPRTAATVFTCRDLSPRQSQSTTLINNLNFERTDQSHPLYHSSPIPGDLAPVRAPSPLGLVRNLTGALGRAMKD